MKRLLPFGFALALISSAFAACTMDFDQFKPGAGGAAGAGGSGGGGGMCTAECCTAADCPVSSDPCVTATCVANVCGTQPVADGMPANDPAKGDCQGAVCQGGAAQPQADDTDVPDSPGACLVGACSMGMPAPTPADAGAACAADGGKVCDGAGKCVECLSATDCTDPAKGACDDVAHVCVPESCTDMKKSSGETDVDCGGMTCGPCADGKSCNQGSDCINGVCEGPGGNTKCSGATCVDKVKNGAETDTDCGGACPPCGDGKDCAGSNANCTSGYCDPNTNKCAPKGDNGSPCANGGQCTSGFCADGVCCNTACMGSCMACAAMKTGGMNGACGPVTVGTDPDNDCSGNQVCNGMGNCKKPDGTSCNNTNECLTGHFCADGVCCATACAGTCETCNGSMAGTCTKIADGQDPDTECAGVTVCDGAGACKKLADGATCTMAAECASNQCVDGVCCENACAGTCQACSAMKSGGMDGKCTPVPAGMDPDNECNAGTPNCNGMGMCAP